MLAEPRPPMREEDRLGDSVARPLRDVPLQAMEQLEGDGDVSGPIALAEDPEIVLAVHLDDVIGIELGEFVEPETAVGEDPDDEFVPLGGHRLFEEVDLLAAEHVAGRALALAKTDSLSERLQ